jgi:Uma2 family endonuclease
VASLEEYVLAAQDEYAVDVFTRGSDGQWLLRSFTEPRATIELTSIGVTLRLEELYDRVSFDEAER